MAPLLPKLRGHFAEFLNKGSSARLGILYLPTCVGFGTGALVIDSDFSWQFEIGYFSTHVFDTYHTLAFGLADLPTNQPLCLDCLPSGSLAYPLASSLL